MGLDMQRTRIADALVTMVADLEPGRILKIPTDALLDAFPSAGGEPEALAALLAEVPEAPWHYRFPELYGANQTAIERIKPDGSRRFVSPQEAPRYFRLGEIFLARS